MSFDFAPLGSLLTEKGYIRGPFGSALRRQELKESGIPVYEQQQAIDGHRKFRFFIDKTKYEELKRFAVKNNDLIISCSGTVGRISVIENGDPLGIISQALLILRPRIDYLLPRFLYYFLLSPQGQTELLNASHGAVQLNIAPRAVVEKIRTPVPSIKEQGRIVEILQAIDDRITLLRDTNSTLVAISQALFKSWFIDFDPVHAKQKGQIPAGIGDANAALFPDEFEKCDVGLVPKGWRASTLGESCSYLSRGISPKYTEDSGVLVINQKCIRDFFIDTTKARRHDTSQRKVDGRELKIGDVLVNSTGVGTLGRVAQVLELPEPAIVDSHVTVVRAGQSISWQFLGLALMAMQTEIEAMGEGSTGQTELSRSKLAGLKIIVPSLPVLEVFNDMVSPLRFRIVANANQAKSLTGLRDTLLPRLISGQLRVSEVEEMLDTSETI